MGLACGFDDGLRDSLPDGKEHTVRHRLKGLYLDFRYQILMEEKLHIFKDSTGQYASNSMCTHSADETGRQKLVGCRRSPQILSFGMPLIKVAVDM